MGKHYGVKIIAEVLKQKEEGKTYNEIGKKFGLSGKQVKKLVERYRRKQRIQQSGMVNMPKRRGRPRTKPQTRQEEFVQRIKQLEMEVDLYRSFLQAAGRM